MGLQGGAIPLAEAVDLVMGMRRGPSRVAPHNALRAGSHRVRLFCSAFSGSGRFQRRKPCAQKTAYVAFCISAPNTTHYVIQIT